MDSPTYTGEAERSATPAMWDALLAFLRAYPAAWENVNCQKVWIPAAAGIPVHIWL